MWHLGSEHCCRKSRSFSYSCCSHSVGNSLGWVLILLSLHFDYLSFPSVPTWPSLIVSWWCPLYLRDNSRHCLDAVQPPPTRSTDILESASSSSFLGSCPSSCVLDPVPCCLQESCSCLYFQHFSLSTDFAISAFKIVHVSPMWKKPSLHLTFPAEFLDMFLASSITIPSPHT